MPCSPDAPPPRVGTGAGGTEVVEVRHPKGTSGVGQPAVFGSHSAWACMARSLDRPALSRCSRCCRCVDPDQCDHRPWALYDFIVRQEEEDAITRELRKRPDPRTKGYLCRPEDPCGHCDLCMDAR